MRASKIAASIAKRIWRDSEATADPGLTYLLENARAYYDFTTLSGNSGDVVPATFADLSPNARTLTRNASPVIRTIQIGDAFYNGLNTLPALSSYTMPAPSQSYFNSSFEVIIIFEAADGINPSGSNNYLFGLLYPFNAVGGTACACQALVDVSGNLIMSYGANNTYCGGTTTTPALPNGPTGQQILRMKYDFENEIVLHELNGNNLTITSVGPISAIDPANFNAGALGCGIGARNNHGTMQPVTGAYSILKLVITPIMPDNIVAPVINHLTIENG